MSWWRPQPQPTDTPDPSQWLCKQCAKLDDAYADSVLIKLQYGNYCERCEQPSREGLYVILEPSVVDDQDREPLEPDAVCAQQSYDDAVHADAVAESKWEDEQARETGADRCPQRE